MPIAKEPFIRDSTVERALMIAIQTPLAEQVVPPEKNEDHGKASQAEPFNEGEMNTG